MTINNSFNYFTYRSVFKFDPANCVLTPGQCIEINIEGYNKEVGNVDEEFYCHAIIAKSNKKQIIMTARIVAEFLVPKLVLSKKELHFRIDVDITKTYFFLRGNNFLNLIFASQQLYVGNIGLYFS